MKGGGNDWAVHVFRDHKEADACAEKGLEEKRGCGM